VTLLLNDGLITIPTEEEEIVSRRAPLWNIYKITLKTFASTHWKTFPHSICCTSNADVICCNYLIYYVIKQLVPGKTAKKSSRVIKRGLVPCVVWYYICWTLWFWNRTTVWDEKNRKYNTLLGSRNTQLGRFNRICTDLRYWFVFSHSYIQIFLFIWTSIYAIWYLVRL